MADFPALPLMTDAYIADTQHLTNEEHGIYLRLLMFAWRTPDCALPNDERRLAIMVGVTQSKWAKLRGTILAFWHESDGKLYQKRLTVQRGFVEKNRQQKVNAGNASAKAKSLKNNYTASTAVPTARQHPYPYPKEELASLDSQGKRGAEILSVTEALGPGHGFEPTAIIDAFDRWLGSGFELKDITAGIRKVMRRSSFNGADDLSYFNDAIADAAKDRKAKSPIPPEKFTEQQWAMNIRTYDRTGDWPAAWGAPPGEDGCLVPVSLLEPANVTTH